MNCLKQCTHAVNHVIRLKVCAWLFSCVMVIMSPLSRGRHILFVDFLILFNACIYYNIWPISFRFFFMVDMKCLNKSADSFDPSCKICFDANFNTVFLPCGHLLCCEDCAKTIRTCPMCRSTVDSAKKVFLQWLKLIV